MTKTPFEIRYDLLAMARDILLERMISERTRLENDWNVERELAFIAAHDGKSAVKVPSFPKMPDLSEDEIVSLATKLNEFVSNSKSGEKND